MASHQPAMRSQLTGPQRATHSCIATDPQRAIHSCIQPPAKACYTQLQSNPPAARHTKLYIATCPSVLYTAVQQPTRSVPYSAVQPLAHSVLYTAVYHRPAACHTQLYSHRPAACCTQRQPPARRELYTAVATGPQRAIHSCSHRPAASYTQLQPPPRSELYTAVAFRRNCNSDILPDSITQPSCAILTAGCRRKVAARLGNNTRCSKLHSTTPAVTGKPLVLKTTLQNDASRNVHYS